MNEVQWNPISFKVPAMAVPVLTRGADGKQHVKLDERGQPITDYRVIPKERPRMSSHRAKKFGGFENLIAKQYGGDSELISVMRKGKPIVYTSANTIKFEGHIRNHFFKAYPGEHAVKDGNKFVPVDQYFIGCQRFGDGKPCTLFRQCQDFLDCKECAYRRRNLALELDIYLKDDRPIDIDNIIKIVLDALNQVCFYDDSQFILKKARMFPWSKEEYLDIKIMVAPPHFFNDVILGGYALRKLTADQDLAHIRDIAFLLKNDRTKISHLLDYIKRCDKRTYAQKLTIEDLKQSG